MKIKKGFYKHYTGIIYNVTDAAIHYESGEDLIIYNRNDGSIVIPLSVFLSDIEVDGQKVPRFSLISTVDEDPEE